MRAIQINQHGPAESLIVCECEAPTPSPDQVVIRVKAAGVNPVDTYIATGTNNYTASFPHTPGRDAAGTIEALGENVKHLSLGQRVYSAGTISGASAELCLCNADQVYPLSDQLSFEQGACLGTPYATAWRGLITKAQAGSKQVVLIHGASGGVGLAAIQLAKGLGCTVYGTASSEEGLALLSEQGCDQVFNHHQAEHYQQIQDLGGVDIILEMLANLNLADDLGILKFRGQVIIIGNRGTIEINPRALMAKESRVEGLAIALATAEELYVTHKGIAEAIKAGVVQPVIAKSYALAELPLAHQQVMQSGALGNLVIHI